MVIDEGTFEEWNQDLIGGNPVNYKGIPERVQALQEDRAQRKKRLLSQAKAK